MRPHYSMVIEWSPEDQVFIVSIPELPGARSHADTYKEAAEEGQRLINEWVHITQDEGWVLPEPRVFTASA